MPRGSNPTKVKEWQARLDRFEQSGQSIARFCENEGVSQPSFFQWRRKLKSQGRQTGKSFLPVQITPSLQ
jgi:transposase-like protein